MPVMRKVAPGKPDEVSFHLVNTAPGVFMTPISVAYYPTDMGIRQYVRFYLRNFHRFSGGRG